MKTRKWTAAGAAVVLLLATTVVVAVVTVTACQSGGESSTAAPPPASTAPAPIPGRNLLERHLPVLRYAEEEEFFAVSPDALAEHRDSTLRRGGPGGEVIAAGCGAPQRLSLGFLGKRRYANGQPTGREDALSVARHYRGWADRRQALSEHGDVVYGRVAQGSDGRSHLQYWCFYAFNDSLACWGDTALGAQGDHEGDWEFVQIRLDAAGRSPELVIVSQHKGAEARAWKQVQTIHSHPVIYPALGSHAGAFTAGCHWAWIDFPERGAAPDCNNGRGRQVTPSLDGLDAPWAAWPGRWGTIAAPCTTTRWREPATLVPGSRSSTGSGAGSAPRHGRDGHGWDWDV